ncbi:hypothetical protein AWB79_03278 [Caballeronia hypogeia]|uniref:Uncharacterized protein n=1 Tax=Caballeronia hypogeia TaxID=1777140 RepID=A0A158B791_9BURK|nr:hypothetical protein [Caballeronia hypogeia]SAK65951.1 hypothetical protein AWB79_03278 [Caballeronia hypogeia]
MKTLTIKDLPVTEQLDSRAMSAVRGGYSIYFPSYQSSFDFSATVQQLANQSQNTNVVNGNNVAFAHDITANTHPVQDAKNISNINFGSAPVRELT